MDNLTQNLRAVVGRDGVLSAADELLVYECDGLPQHKSRPRLVVFPRSTEETAETVRVLARAAVPFVPRGAGTGLSGGAVALENGVVIELARMRRLLNLDAENRRVRVETGIVNAHVSRAAAPYGLHYVPDPSSNPTCTVGGNIAENAGGIHCLKYGVTVDHIASARVVLADGEIVELQNDSYGSPGYDLLGVFVGSEGTFGIATEATLQLTPIPPAVRTLLADFAETESASRAVSAIIAHGFIPAALEMMDGRTVRAIEGSVFAVGLPTDAEAVLLIELDGLEAGLDEEAEECAELCRTHGARGVKRARDERERKKLWAARKGAFGAMGRIAPDLMLQDAVVPRSRLPEVLAATYRIGAKYDLTVANVFHAGDGNLHPFICFDSRDHEEVRRVKAAGGEIMEACVRAGGTITGEHGVGLDKSEYLPLIFGETEMDAMLVVRRAFDPRGLCNPGKIIPVRRGCGEGRRFASPPETVGAGTCPARSVTKAHGQNRSLPLQNVAADVEKVGAVLARIVSDANVERGAMDGGVTVAPACVEEVCEVMRAASAEKWSVIPLGNGTWRNTSAIRLSTRRMTFLVEQEPADLVATAEAGMTLVELNRRLAGANQWLPLDSHDDSRATLGGILATNAAGAQRLGYGAPRDLCTGMRVVLADGRTLRAGGRVVKNVAGYDLPKLFTGSHGTLGVIVEATFKLRPRPATEQTVAAYGDVHGLLRAARRILNAPLFPVALELVSPALASRILASDASGDYTLLVRFAGANLRVDSQTASAHLIFREERISSVTATDEQQIWQRLAAASSPHDDGSIRCERMPQAQLATRLADMLTAGDDTNAFRHAGLGDGRLCVAQTRSSMNDKGEASIGNHHARAPEPGVTLLIKRVKNEFDPTGVFKAPNFVA